MNIDENPIFHLIIQVSRAHYINTHRFLEVLGLYHGQPPLLHILWEKDGRSQKEIAQQLNIKQATVAKMVKRMTKEGIIYKKRDPEDQRISRIYLTEHGKKLESKVKGIETKIEDICTKGFTEEEKILLQRFLTNIKANLKDH